MKANIFLRNQIKELSTEQRSLKNQRKTAKLVGDRKMQPWEAVMRHGENRHNLRVLFAAYGVLRGKAFSQIESGHLDEGHPLNEFKNEIQKIVDSYAEAVRTGE